MRIRELDGEEVAEGVSVEGWAELPVDGCRADVGL
jgi:hypothetical protein